MATEKAYTISRKTTGTCRLTPEEFQTAYSKLRDWIQKTLEFHEKNAKAVALMHFVRLPLYFDPSLLETAKFIAIDHLQMPPLSAMGLSRFAVFEQGDFNGITYLDRYFIKQAVETQEALHFHELIHVIQWRLLGPEGFLGPMQMGLRSLDTRTARSKRWPTMLKRYSNGPLQFSMQRSLSPGGWAAFCSSGVF